MGLVVSDVKKSFDSTEVLSCVSFTAQDGELVCLLGPNGSGKTTILKLIAGLEEVTSGSITLDDEPAAGSHLPIGYVFQQHALLPWRTIRQNIAYGLELAGTPRAELERSVDGYIQLMGLEDFAAHYPRQLSGGMQQKVGIARALAIDPKIVLMDEPFAALDAQTRNILQAELLRVWETTKKTVLFVTHSVDEAVYLADRIVMLSERPAVVRECIPVRLGRPRDRTSQEFNDLRREVLRLLGEESPDQMETMAPPQKRRDLYSQFPDII